MPTTRFSRRLRTASLATVIALSHSSVFAGSNDKLVKAINTGIQQAIPNITVVNASKTPVQGLYQVEAEDGTIFYTDKNGEFFAKELFEIKDSSIINVAEAAYAENRARHMTDINHDELISFKPEGKARGEIFVFTDVNCPYCRKFHQQLVPAANKMGITVSYFAYPVIGGEKSMKQMQSAWCAAPQERADMLDKLKNGEAIDENLCKESPIEGHVAMGREMKIGGTPTVLFSDGSKLDLTRFEADLKAHFGDS